MFVLIPTPKTCPLCLALATAVVRVPLLAPEALADTVGIVNVSWFLSRRLTPVVFIPKEDAIPEYSFLSLLIFKSYKYPPDFGLSPSVLKPDEIGHLEIISLFNLSTENVITQVRIYSCDASLKF